MVITGTLFFAFTREKTYIPPASPDVTYITSYAPDRTDTEIVASNIANQKRKDALAARIAEREELRKELYRSLGRATGLDVDQMEAEIQAERALEEAEAQRAQTQGAQAPGAQALPTNTSDSGSTVANQPE